METRVLLQAPDLEEEKEEVEEEEENDVNKHDLFIKQLITYLGCVVIRARCKQCP